MKYIRHIAVTLLCLTALGAAAQQAVESAVKTLINSKSITNEIYSERRNPKTKAIVRSDRVFNFTDNKIASKIVEAIRKERDKASAFQMNSRPGNAIYKIVFDNDKGKYARYTLVQEGESSWMLSIIKTSGSKSGKHDSSMLIESDGNVFDTWYDFDNLGSLGELGNTKELYVNMGMSAEDAALLQQQQAEFVRQQGEFARLQGEFTKQKREYNKRQAAEARKQAALARQQAAEARKQAAEVRKQAAVARQKAAKARQEAAVARQKAAQKRANSKSNSSSSSSNYYVTDDKGNSTYSVTYTRS